MIIKNLFWFRDLRFEDFDRSEAVVFTGGTKSKYKVSATWDGGAKGSCTKLVGSS